MRLLQTDPTSQATNGAERVVLGVGVPREIVRKPRVHGAGNRIFESLGRDARYLVRFTAQLNGGTDDRRIAGKTRAPEPVAQHDAARSDRRTSPRSNFVAPFETGSAQRARPQRVKVVARDAQHAEPLSPSVPDEIQPGFAVVGERSDGLERTRLIAER